MRAKEFVISIYPSAECHKVNFCARFRNGEWRVCYWKTINATPIHALLGIGKTKTEAWKSASQSIQKTMLNKFEYGIEAG
jgi:succinate dehydrogenase hydrophobic anchor subunit